MPDDTPTDGDGSSATDTDTPKNQDQLGDAGKKALDEERSARKAAEKAARDVRAELETLRAASMSDQEKAVAAAREEGKTDALKTANERLVKAEIKVAASGRFANPDHAVRLLDHDDFVIDGEVDERKLAKAVDLFLKDNPNLAANGGRRADFDGGARNGAPAGDDMSALIRHAAGRA